MCHDRATWLYRPRRQRCGRPRSVVAASATAYHAEGGMYEHPWPSDIALPSPDRIRTTPKCLLSLALHCPHLGYLSIPIDLSSCAESDGSPGRGVEHSQLVTLYVGPVMGRQLDDEETMSAMAVPLSNVFPSSLYVGSVLWPEVPKVKAKFEELSNLVRILAEARQRQRNELVAHI
ncbi:hypothetical protein BD626DRAFT_140677 [Schizophyllum amplum]|uniref:Uncharacterized protein n=1 Tax=Schizophyllum amplum TaxID=97359 RepID=A0A550C5F3_9AGAR|nr:hypothetical protein BD626DRAFT_140677 [Auriculariopsis ampla]